MNLEKAKILDAILLKFTGNKTITWHEIKEGAFIDIETYYVIENNINFLVGDGQLERDSVQAFSLSMTDKGFATMTDLPNLGYVTTAKKERNIRRWANISGVIVILTFLILIYDTWFNKQKPIPAQTETTQPANRLHETQIDTNKDNAKIDSLPRINDTP